MNDPQIGLQKPQEPAEEDLRQYMTHAIRVSEVRTAQAERLMLRVREFGRWIVAIFFLAGVNVGVWAAKLWWNL